MNLCALTASSLLVGAFLTGRLCSQATVHHELWPPYSNPLYSCRCLPMVSDPEYQSIKKNIQEVFSVHKKLCEYKTYVRSLERYVAFLDDVFVQDGQNIAGWFASKGKKLDIKIVDKIKKKTLDANNTFSEKEVKAINEIVFYYAHRSNNKKLYEREIDIKKQNKEHIKALLSSRYPKILTNKLHNLVDASDWFYLQSDFLTKAPVHVDVFRTLLSSFPFEIALSKAQTEPVKKALMLLKEKQSFVGLTLCWEQIKTVSFDANTEELLKKNIEDAYITLKDFTTVVTLLYCHCSGMLEQKLLAQGSRASRFDSLLGVAQKVNDLPIAQTLTLIDQCGHQLLDIVGTAHQQDQTPLSFSQWLQKSWPTLTVSVGVIIIKTLQYFSGKTIYMQE